MKILITGITGFIGSHLAMHLHDRGFEIAGLHRPGSALPAFLPPIRHWPASDDGQGFREALMEFRPDVVVHLAALYIPEHRAEDIGALVRANIQYGAHLLEAMKEAGCTAMIFAGTSWQHYRDAHYCPANLYAATKQAFSSLADYYRDACKLRMLELHIYDCYGPNDPRSKLIYQLRQAALTGQTLPMSGGEQHIHLVHIDDLTLGMAMACNQVLEFPAGHHHIYRLPSPSTISLRDLVALFNKVSTRPAPVSWGERPYREREVFTPWENGAVLPGWEPRISLTKGLRDICR